ncbi:MAG: sulfotransferase family protein [Pseudomonadota bacterium]
MDLQIIGAGLPRTGTMSLKQAIELLLGGTCYHMDELYRRPEHVRLWVRVLKGDVALLPDILDGYCAALDWPFSGVWKSAAEIFPDAHVLLSQHESPQTWWDSADQTVWDVIRRQTFRFSDDPELSAAFSELHHLLTNQFCPAWNDENAAKGAYAAHLAAVKQAIPATRLITHQIGAGWSPLCRALGIEEPDQDFPIKNDRASFKTRNTI